MDNTVIGEFALLSDLDGTLIDSQASVIRAFEWWVRLRGFDPAVVDRLPTSTDAAAELAPDLDAKESQEL
jgi:beta-phosphoglucomutase-like phosphatase (HAD superfamily)